MTPDLHRKLMRAPAYARATVVSQGMLRAAVIHAQLKHAVNPFVRVSGYIGFRPSFCELQYAGRDEPSLTVSLFGAPAAYEANGLKEILVPAQKGYSRARIYDISQLPLLFAALEIAWELRARRMPRMRGGSKSENR